MFHVILHEPEIPPNTGNVIRLCANTGCSLHLVGRLGFDLTDAQLRRAGLDYHEMARVRQHADLAACVATLDAARVFAVETAGARCYADERFQAGDAFLFGKETVGLPPGLLDLWPQDRLLRIPMRAGNRSVNLSNSVALVVYEAWRQLGYAGAAPPPA